MNLQAEKLHLIQLLLDIEDPKILSKIEALIKINSKESKQNNWDIDLEKEIQEAINQADNGALIPHKEAVGKLKRW